MTTLEGPRRAELPRWDVTNVFPSLESREYAAARESVSAGITRLSALYDEHDVRGGAEREVDDATVAAFDEVIAATNELLDRLRIVGAFTSSFVTTDARDDQAQAELSAMQAEQAELSRLRGRFDAWVASLGPGALVARSTVAADHAFPLERAALRATHQMTEAEEGLAADLQLTGGSAWSRLYRDVTARLTATVRSGDGGGGEETMPFSAVRGLAFDPDGDRRRRAYEAELEACRSVAVPIAAALNGIKGEAITLNRRRGWADGLEPALANNNVDRATLDAMQEAVVASFPDFRRYLRAKARLLGRDGGLPWYDLFGPVGGEHAPRYAWDEATDAVRSSFGGYSERLEGLARRALDEQWV
ncbi:MAG TPA: hypothetical protein VM030_08940, partial [Acidimicrobiales bacterium]|nr:hypothetical protein [Acidimicrobiales bacterium]